jgi:murein tripeptide amidase MpaA
MRYLNVEEIDAALNVLALSHPDVTELITLPNRTWEGRESHALRIGPPDSAGNDTVVVLGGVHAREWVPPDALVNLAADLLEAFARGTGLRYGGQYFTADQVRTLVGELQLVLFPCVNPDGRHRSQTVREDALWRKNRRRVEGSAPDCLGVDINRNFDALWDFRRHFAEGSKVSASDDPCDPEVYVGPAAASEAETRNVVWLLDRYPHTGWFVDLHSYVPATLYTWGFDIDQTTDPAKSFRNAAFDGQRGLPNDGYREFIPVEDLLTLKEVGASINEAIAAVNGSSYALQQSYSLGPTSGCSDDYAYSRHFVRPGDSKILSFTIECGTSFQPTWQEAEGIIREACAGLTALCVAARKWSSSRMRDREAQGAAIRMADVVNRRRSVAINVSSHARLEVAGREVAWWFNEKNASTEEFLEALAGDRALVTPGAPDQSKLVTRYLRPTTAMGDTLGADCDIIRKWIAAGCPIPPRSRKREAYVR